MHEIHIGRLADAYLCSFISVRAGGYPEANTQRPRTTRQHDAGTAPPRGVRPAADLIPPAVDRVLEVADDGEYPRRRARRQPVNHGKRLPGEDAERLFILLTPPPGVREVGRRAVQDCAARTGQEDETQEHAKHVAMRRDQRLFDCQTRYLRCREALRR